MDWFEHITGFKERDYATTQAQLEVAGNTLRSGRSQKSYSMGEFSTPSLKELRAQAQVGGESQGRMRVSLVSGDVRKLHQASELKGALFQVASQFNMLEMTSFELTPEDGVTRYRRDPTQGPACAIAAGAAIIYRNYLVPFGGLIGQRADHQIDGLADVGGYLSEQLGMAVSELWTMRNGYCLGSKDGLVAISALMEGMDDAQRDAIRSLLRIGLHQDVQVTDEGVSSDQLVTQAFCSALPVAYSPVPSKHWCSFATLVLEAAYEATLWAGACNARRGASNVVLLTRLGGGAFGNADDWIHSAMMRALQITRHHALDVRIVSYREPSPALHGLVTAFA